MSVRCWSSVITRTATKWNWALVLCFIRIRATSMLLTSMVLKYLYVFWDVLVVEMYIALR
jgi:hypothetical protein